MLRYLYPNPVIPGTYQTWLRPPVGRCESVDRLLAYYHGELPEAEADPVQEHLSLCRDCADLVLAIPAFLGDEDPEGAPVARK
jgi:hypothetical protein